MYTKNTQTWKILRLKYLPNILEYLQELFNNTGRNRDPKVNIQNYCIIQPTNCGSAQLQLQPGVANCFGKVPEVMS